MNIIVAGIIGRHPYGGVAWCSLMYLLGLRKLGHNVWYLEDTCECNFDPIGNTLTTNPEYALRFIDQTLTPYGFGDRWCYVDIYFNYYNHTRESWCRICADADVFINLSGGAWYWKDEYAAIPYRAYIDSDPAFTQLDIAKKGQDRIDFFNLYNALFTFGRNIGTARSPVPTAPLHWEPTWQPVDPDHWSPLDSRPRDVFTTVMTWKFESFADIGGTKDLEFLKVVNLPAMTDVPLELAVTNAPRVLLEQGWQCRDAFAVSDNLEAYRDYLRTSRGEFSVAKHTYVATNSGWFSDRTECYLMAGRPAIVQDTGFSAHLPTGRGLFAFNNAEEARAGLEAAVADYSRHARAARELARSEFAFDVVLPPLLERATSGPPRVAVPPSRPSDEAQERHP
jgi:hypothetical protein